MSNARTPEQKAKKKLYNQSRRELLNARARENRRVNGDAIRAYYRDRDATPEGKQRRAQYQENQGERPKVRGREYYQKNKETRNAAGKEWAAKNREKLNARGRARRASDPEFAKASAAAQKRHYAKHPEKKKEQYQKHYDPSKQRERYNSDPKFKMMRLLRSRLRLLVKKKKTGKAASTAELCGCTFEEFAAHLERLFQDGMTWENHGFGPGFWNVDHVRPIASFDLTIPDHQRECFHFSNLQPLWHEDNAAKGAKVA